MSSTFALILLTLLSIFALRSSALIDGNGSKVIGYPAALAFEGGPFLASIGSYGSVAKRDIFAIRDATCNAGAFLCPNTPTEVCCPTDNSCCGAGICIPPGDTCCPGGYGGCLIGHACCPPGCMLATSTCCPTVQCFDETQCCGTGCMPQGAVCCPTATVNSYCYAGDTCCGDGLCAPNGTFCCSGSEAPCKIGQVCTSLNGQPICCNDIACSELAGTNSGNTSSSGSRLSATSTQTATPTTSGSSTTPTPSGSSTATTKAGGGSKTIVFQYGLSVVIFLTFGIGLVL